MEYLIVNRNPKDRNQFKIKIYNHSSKELNNKEGYLVSNDKKGNCIVKIDNQFYKVNIDRIKLI